MEEKLKKVNAILKKYHQEHLLAFYNELNKQEKIKENNEEVDTSINDELDRYIKEAKAKDIGYLNGDEPEEDDIQEKPAKKTTRKTTTKKVTTTKTGTKKTTSTKKASTTAKKTTTKKVEEKPKTTRKTTTRKTTKKED